MGIYINTFIVAAGFAVVALASRQIGEFFVKIRLPLISGFLFTGVIVGPFILDLIPAQAIEHLGFVDEIALAFIAFAAGSELYLKELRTRFKSIAWVTIGNVVAIPTAGSLAVFLLADFIPFMQPMSIAARIAAAILAGAILVARSPSSAIAVVNELRAKGPFTQTVLGVTMITDVAVIILFAISSSIADVFLTNLDFNLSFMLLVLVELLLAMGVGYILGKFLQIILAHSFNSHIKTGIILLAGYAIFLATEQLRAFSHSLLPFEIFLEPLLICLVGSFVVTNYSDYRTEFLKILHDTGPPIYIAFFTLTGAALALDVLAQTWTIALVIFVVRLVAIFIGSFSGGLLAGDPMHHNRVSWMAYVAQAGVGLGLAKEVAAEFPEIGNSFATMIISVIVLTQIIGPPIFKWAINTVGEAHPRAPTPEFDGVRDAIIFGIEGQAIALAHQLQAHGWQVKVVANDIHDASLTEALDINVQPIAELSLETLRQLDAEHADAIVTLLSDEEDYQICELVYEHFGTKTVVARLNDQVNVERFRKLDVLVIDPRTAIVSLLDHLVRSPLAAPLLLGSGADQDIIDVEVRDLSLHGVALRDLNLPLDTLILSVYRDGHTLISHGYTQLKLGDRVTVVGSPESLDKLMLRFDA